ncbi:hypothetical protein ACVME8_007051 [Bradyrhizobium diazoefficiens]
MQIVVSLNAGAVDAADIRTTLDAELHGLAREGAKITTEKKPVEAGALSFAAEAYQFILDYGPAVKAALPLITAVLQVSNAVLQRRGITSKNKPKASKKAKSSKTAQKAAPPQPVVVVQVEGRSINLPADSAQLKKFVSAFSKPELPAGKRAPKKKAAQPKKRATKG